MPDPIKLVQDMADAGADYRPQQPVEPHALEAISVAAQAQYQLQQEIVNKTFEAIAQAANTQMERGSEAVPLFAPTGPQLGGENSSLSPGFLPEGMFPIVENLVPDDRSAQVRKGSSAAFAGTGSTATVGNTEFRTWANMIAYYGSGGKSAPLYRGHCYDAKTGILYVAIGYTEGGSGYTDVVWYSPAQDRWTWKTRSSGATDYYGNTRFTGNSEMIQMQIVEEKHWFDTDAFAGATEYGYLVAIYPDGKQWPRCAPSVDNTTLHEFAIHQPITSPEPGSCWSQARFARWFALDDAETVITNTGTKIAGTVNTTDDYIAMSIGAGGVLGSDFMTIDFGAVTYPVVATVTQAGRNTGFNPWGTYTGAGVSTTELLMKYLVFSISDESVPIGYDLWRNLRIRICPDTTTPPSDAPAHSAVAGGATAWKTIFDGAYVNNTDADGNSYPEPIKITYSDGSNRYLIAFAIPKNIVTSQVYRFLAITQSASGGPPSADGSFKIECIALTSGLPGFTQFGVTYFHSQSRAESPFVVCRKSLPARLEEMGGRVGTIRIPESDGLVYNHRVYSPQLDSTRAPTGTEYVLTYAKPYKGDWGLLSGDQQRAQVYSGGAWGYATGNSGNNMPDVDASAAGQQRIRHVTVEIIVPRTPPSALNVGIPPGVALATANQRLFVGGARMFRSSATIASPLGDTSAGGYSVACSKALCPFHFDPFLQFLADGSVDPNSPAVAYIAGDKVTALHTFSSGDIGGDSVIAFSSSGTYTISGLDAYQLSKPTKVGDVGCVAPYSVASNSRTVFWLDDQGQVRAYGEDGGVISRDMVDNQTRGIPLARRKFATGAVFADKYVLGFTESGQSENTRALVFDTVRKLWYGYRSSLYAYGGLVTIFDAGERKILCFDTNGEGIYQLETSSSTDAGTAISVALQSREIHAGYYNRVKGEDVTILATGHATDQFTVTWTSLGVASPVTSTVDRDVDSGSTLVWVNARSGTQPVPGYQVKVSGPMAAGDKIYALWVENSMHYANPRSSE